MITNLCLMRPDPQIKELLVVAMYAGAIRDQVSANAGWSLRFAETVEQTPPPDATELAILRDLQARTARAHTGQVAAHG